MTTAARDLKLLFTSRLTETHLFCEVGRIIASELEPSELVQKIITLLRKNIGFDEASVYIVKKDLTGLMPVYFSSPLLQGKLSQTISFDTGAPGRIAATGEPLAMNDVMFAEGFLHHPDEPRQQGCYIGIPLQNDDSVAGVMCFSRREPASFRVEDLDLLRMLSHTIAAGLEKAELFKKTLELSRIDELTGMFNYRVLLEMLDKEASRQIRTGSDLSFIMVDIDNFKRINDRCGHLEGSRVLAQLGALLIDAFRTGSTDTCFRYGGDEFSILLGETGFDGAMLVAERVRQMIEEFPFTRKSASQQASLTVSLGVSTIHKGDKKTIKELIHEADVALYRSKASGKNRVTGYDKTLLMPVAEQDDEQRKP